MKRVIVKIVYTTLIIGIFSNIISQNKPTVNEVKQRIEIINKKIGEKGFSWKAGKLQNPFFQKMKRKSFVGFNLMKRLILKQLNLQEIVYTSYIKWI